MAIAVRPEPMLSRRELAALLAIPMAWYVTLWWYVTYPMTRSWVYTIRVWDGGWYHRIKERGYWLTDPSFETQQSLAFFPGISWTGRFFDWFLPYEAAMFVSVLFWGVTAAVTVGVAARHVGIDPVGAALVMAAYPAVFFTFMFYSDALAISGSALIIIGLLGQRTAVGFVGGVIVGVARPVAIGVNGITLLVALWKGEGRPKEFLSSCAGMATGLVAVIVAQHQAGDALGFLKAQGAWERELAYPLGALVDAVRKATDGPLEFIDVYTLGSMGAVLFMLVVLIRASLRGDWPWTLTALACAAAMLPMATNDSSGHLRYLMHAWPAWIYVVNWLPKRWMQLGLLACGAPITLWLMGRFAVTELLVS